MADNKVKCRWPTCENDTDCMSGCKPAPPMTPAPSIKEALEPCPFCGSDDILISDNVEVWGQGSDQVYARCNCCGANGPSAYTDQTALTKWNTRATFQPDGERREAIALQIWNDRLKRRGETTVTMETVRSAKERGFDILAMDRPTADAILASGLVQDEAGIRRDEREKCAEIADLRYEPVATEIAAAIRSARDGGAS